MDAHTHLTTYNVHQTVREPRGALIDVGANGGLSASDVVVLHETLNTADVNGIADNTLHQLKLCTVAALIQSHSEPILVSLTNMHTMVAVKNPFCHSTPTVWYPC
jgi:hypothetical protein